MSPFDIPPPEIRPYSRWIPSLVWIVPLVCALIGLSLVIRTVAATGPTITVTFANADGLEAGKTKVRYRTSISARSDHHAHPDFKRVIASIQLTRDAARFANRDTRFWVVRPRVGATGISEPVHCSPVHTSARISAAPAEADRLHRSRDAAPSPLTSRAAAICCMATRSARSTSARRCSIGICRSVRSSASRSTRTGPASTCRRS